MTSIASIILALLKVAGILLQFAQQKKWMDAGADAEVAKASAAVLILTETAKETMIRVTSMNEEQVDQALKELEL